MPPGPLHSAGGIEFREESKKHASSLPSTAQENKKALARGFRRALSSRVVADDIGEISEVVEVNVGRICGAIVHTKTIVHCGGPRASIARGLYVHFGIANEQSVTR